MKNSRAPRLAAILALVLALTSLAFNSGCIAVAAGAGAGAVAYIRGDLNATLDSSFDHTFKASQRAVQQLEFAKVSEAKDALLGKITVRNAADKKIEIKIERAGDNLTKVSIRVGTFGDETLSMAILDKIKSNL
ncbi:MAG: DUF3568 family protein [Verrucomicrobia bacterium]|nr:DUF3568 family protein [Verrucomicrobiota bacterium]